MRKALLALALIVSLLGAAWAGHYKGYGDAYVAWESQIESAYSAMAEGTYQMAWTNTRACVLAVDSSFMRFLSTPTPEVLSELRSRYGACEQHWELLHKYSPDDPEEYRNIDEARWMFDNWGDQIDWALELQVRMIVAFNSGDDLHAAELYKSLLEARGESKKFRDHIERELFEAW
jgi:hypothetical protein